MGREVRRVPADWDHPKDYRGEYKPLYDASFVQRSEEWLKDFHAWESGENPSRATEEAERGRRMYYWEWDDNPPNPHAYMPDWKPEERTHYQMYENVSEGSPVSPVFATAEELARYLSENGDYWDQKRGTKPASYEAWLRVCTGGYAPSMVLIPGKGLLSGVEAMDVLDKREPAS